MHEKGERERTKDESKKWVNERERENKENKNWTYDKTTKNLSNYKILENLLIWKKKIEPKNASNQCYPTVRK